MREELLGYLLGALDEDERRRVDRALAHDAGLRAELQTLRQELDALQASETAYEPAGDLLDQTCDLVEGMRLRAQDAEGRGDTPKAPGREVRFSEGRQQTGSISAWSRADLLVTTAMALVLAAMFLPAIANSRFRSNINTCQHNLQVIGVAMVGYSDRNHGRFPEIPLEGNRGVAGIFGPLLLENQYLTDDGFLVCPGSALATRKTAFRAPKLKHVDRYTGRLLSQMRHAMGGSYGYSLGYFQDGKYCPPENHGRSHYALMADAPTLHLLRGQSDNHAGRGQNVLFEDMHVQFFPNCDELEVGDAFFRNHDGLAKAGVNAEDTSIGASAAAPCSAIVMD
jgi:hypothetical protein